MIISFLNFLIMVIFILISMAFFTLLERKILGYTQLRKGPNKVSISGLLQPISDAVKLFTKEKIYLIKSNNMLFNLSSMGFLWGGLALWLINPIYTTIFFNSSILIFLCLSSINVYCVLFSGWSSNSKYSLLGSMRNVSQMISYEISMFLIFISILMFKKNMNIYIFFKYSWMWSWMMLNLIFMLWMVTMLAELGRAPLDFNEGESELVSGFNTEYGGGLFAFIFMAEYMNIIFIMLLTSILFMGMVGGWMMIKKLSLVITTIFYCSLVLFIRSTYPRFRYDMLMSLTWKSFLPLSILVLLSNCLLQ